MILNLKSLNYNIPYIHFKMEIINLILNLITPNCFMTKVDIKVGLSPSPRKLHYLLE